MSQDPSQGETDPAWSPDGTRIAFTAGVDLYVTTPDGTADGPDRIRLTNVNTEGGPASNPDWSPDGTKLVFSRNFGDPMDGAEIWMMDANGANQRLVASFVGYDIDPTWAPDGTRIAFRSDAFEGVATMRVDGTDARFVAPAFSLIQEPSWQPLSGPQRSDYRNAAQFCKAERDFLGDAAFVDRYGKGNGANAYGKCVKRNS